MPLRVGSLAPKRVARRVYRVPWINSLWHVDGHHKLIRWKIVIHGCIDGFSRMITFIRASDNNRAETVRASFETAIEEFGLPSRVRADHGKENYGIKDIMEGVRGECSAAYCNLTESHSGLNRGSFIQGSSTHNQRIERLWVDLQRWCTKRYVELFKWMEDGDELDPDKPLDLWALHFCYLPMLNQSLDGFQARWNMHGLRTMHNNSPRLIWLKCE